MPLLCRLLLHIYLHLPSKEPKTHLLHFDQKAIKIIQGLFDWLMMIKQNRKFEQRMEILRRLTRFVLDNFVSEFSCNLEKLITKVHFYSLHFRLVWICFYYSFLLFDTIWFIFWFSAKNISDINTYAYWKSYLLLNWFR